MDVSPLQQAASFIRRRAALRPRVGLILGSGLGGFAGSLAGATNVPYSEIPGWPRSTAEGHAGLLAIGEAEGTPVAVMAGRAHLYEGYSAAETAFGVRALALLGVRKLVVTNAAGAIRTGWRPGQFVLISDHINLQGANPLTGPNLDELGPRFPDMTEAYPARLRQVARTAGERVGVSLAEGVYAAVTGPSYETPAEIRFLRAIGADLVGMSTVAEVIAARHAGMDVLGISTVTNLAAGLSDEPLSHTEVLEAGRATGYALARLLREMLPELAPAE